MKLQNNLMLVDVRNKRMTTIPVVELVALKQSDGVISAITTDLDTMAIASWRNNAEGEWTALVNDLPKTGLTSIRKQGSTIELVDETMMKQEVLVELYLNYDDYPEFKDDEPILGKLTMPTKDWAEALAALDKVMDKDNVRGLDNIWIMEYSGETVLVATDGYRLSCYHTGQYNNAPSDKVSVTKSFIRATKRALKQAEGDITIEWADTYIHTKFKVGNVDYEVYSKRITPTTAPIASILDVIVSATPIFTAEAKEMRNLLKHFNKADWVKLKTEDEWLLCQSELSRSAIHSRVQYVVKQELGKYHPKLLLGVLPTKETKLDFCTTELKGNCLVINKGRLSTIVMGFN